MKLIQIETARDRRITYEKHACSYNKNNLDSVASVKIKNKSNNEKEFDTHVVVYITFFTTLYVHESLEKINKINKYVYV